MRFGCFVAALLFSCTALAAEWQTQTLSVADSDIPLLSLEPERPQAQVIWLPSEYGLLPQERKLAEQLADKGLRVVFIDPYEPLFLAPTDSAFAQIPPSWIVALLQQQFERSLPTWIIAPNKAGVLALQALEQLQLQQPLQQVGLLLLNPNLYLNTPEPGKAAQFWPQVSNSNLPISVVQGELTSLRWHLPALQNALAQQGSDVFVQLLPAVRDRFYFRPDALAQEQQAAQVLSAKLMAAMHWQLPYFQQPRTLSHASVAAKPQPLRSLQLQPYQGPQDLPLRLQASNGEEVDLAGLQGKVILLNFWASWCPPCVHEMPSMAQLKQHLAGQPFDILAVNLGESPEAIAAFSKQHPLNFPILLDPQGQAVKDWQVFAYPSSYLLDKQGRIRYALFGGTDWMEAHHLEKIAQLFAQPSKVSD